MRIRGLSLAATALFGFCSYAQLPGTTGTPAPTNAWSTVSGPSTGNPEAIGFYSSGCIRGAKQISPDGIGYQSMRLYRNRQFAHPELIEFITHLSRTIDSLGSGLLIGDIAQARGGPLPFGHASHQVGLDVDIWFWTHPEQRVRSLTLDERNTLPMVDMLNANGLVDPSVFTQEQILKLKMASSDPKVERIFVNPAIKTYLCSVLDEKELPWLHKLRPWPGHNEHFHVRISCPFDSKLCVKQDPVPPGDGCKELLPPRGSIIGGQNDGSLTPAIEKLFSTNLPEACNKLLKE
jgi:penicillin-insensitive murein endopeptidase